MNYYLAVLKKYAVFNGRATRAEYWYFILFNALISFGIGFISEFIQSAPNVLSGLYSLAVFLPSLAVGARRLHDTGRSAWWLLLILIPFIGWIALLVFFVGKSEEGSNKYGSRVQKDAPKMSSL